MTMWMILRHLSCCATQQVSSYALHISIGPVFEAFMIGDSRQDSDTLARSSLAFNTGGVDDFIDKAVFKMALINEAMVIHGLCSPGRCISQARSQEISYIPTIAVASLINQLERRDYDYP